MVPYSIRPKRLVLASHFLFFALGFAVTAQATPVGMIPSAIVTGPAPGDPLRLTLLVADTDDPLNFVFRLEPVSGLWNSNAHNGFYTIHFFSESGARANTSIEAIPNGQTFIGLSFGCGPLGCFDALKSPARRYLRDDHGRTWHDPEPVNDFETPSAGI